jgi:cell division protein FtsQ
MARKSASTIVQEELYPPSAPAREEYPREELEDARLVDLDVDEESPFLRGQKRVSARRSSLPRKAASRLLWASIAAIVLCVGALGAAGLYDYGQHSWRFRIESSDEIEISGMQNVTKAQIMEVMGADIGRNIFFVPLSQQRAQLEQIPWVESASVMRFVPNRLKIEIHERTPIAFARVGPRIELIDAGGTLMELPKTAPGRAHKYSFPVILGMYPGEPLSTRSPRMKAYNELVQQLDSGGAHYSQDLSEVDLTDLDDLKVRINDPAGDVLIELGSSDFLKRYKTYVSHVQEWRQQFQKIESVNLRYDNQVIVNPDIEGKPRQAALTATAAKAAASAGVKPAALVTRIGSHDPAIPKPAFELSPKKLDPRGTAAKKPAARPKARRMQARMNRAGKSQPSGPAVANARTTAQPTGKKTPQSVAAAANSPAIPKPSAAIAQPKASSGQN